MRREACLLVRHDHLHALERAIVVDDVDRADVAQDGNGQARERPQRLPKDVSPENVKFVEDHEAELKAIQKEWEALEGGR